MNEQTNQQTDFANQWITKQAAIDALGERPIVWDDLSDFDLGKAAQWSDDVDAIKALPSAQPEQRWIPVTKEEMFKAGYEGREIRFRVDGRLFAIRELAQ